MEHSFKVITTSKNLRPDETYQEIGVIIAEVITHALEQVPWIIDYRVSEDNNASTPQGGSEVQAGSSDTPEHGGEEA